MILSSGSCVGAALFGVTWLALILFTLFYNGLAGISLQIFTENTPPPGSTEGGLLNAIVGSIIMTVIGVGIGAPLGLFAGTYLAEYGRNDRLTAVIRFINDILLSAPVDHHRPVRLWRGRGADGRVLGLRRKPGARRDRHSRGGAHHRGHAVAGAQSAARGGFRARPAALARHQASRLPRGALRPHYRRAAGDGAGGRRNRAAAVHRASAISSSVSI